MAGSMSDYFEKKVLDNIFRSVSLGLDATNVWVGLFTVAPTDSAAGTEVTGGAYARMPVIRTGTGWTAAAGALAATTNVSVVTFPTATASWGTVVAFGIFDALTAGNLLYWGDLTTLKIVGIGDTAFVAASAISITQD